MRGQTIQLYQPVTLVTEECCNCGVIFGLTSYMKNELVQSHNGFYCPNGHAQSYRGESDAEKNARLLREEQDRHRRTIAQKNEAEQERLKMERKLKRVGRGVCPDCNRTFTNLARHMNCKHAA